MNPHLFVYGSLMSTAGHAMGARLRREAQLVGEAWTPGRLYRVSWYPGLAETDEGEARVWGEVYRLANPGLALAWLDAYEGIVPGEHDRSEYERAERPVRLASGEQLTAWVYLYRRNVTQLTLVADGRWVMGRG